MQYTCTGSGSPELRAIDLSTLNDRACVFEWSNLKDMFQKHPICVMMRNFAWCKTRLENELPWELNILAPDDICKTCENTCLQSCLPLARHEN